MNILAQYIRVARFYPRNLLCYNT